MHSMLIVRVILDFFIIMGYDFREEVSGPYSGYYVIDAFAKEDGLTIEYSNGNKTTTNYFPYPSAEDVIKAVIDHSAVD